MDPNHPQNSINFARNFLDLTQDPNHPLPYGQGFPNAQYLQPNQGYSNPLSTPISNIPMDTQNYPYPQMFTPHSYNTPASTRSNSDTYGAAQKKFQVSMIYKPLMKRVVLNNDPLGEELLVEEPLVGGVEEPLVEEQHGEQQLLKEVNE